MPPRTNPISDSFFASSKEIFAGNGVCPRRHRNLGVLECTYRKFHSNSRTPRSPARVRSSLHQRGSITFACWSRRASIFSARRRRNLPGRIPFPLLHIDTSYKFPEMIEFRDSYAKQIGAELIVHKNQEALDAGANPFLLGTQKCCGLLKTKSLLDALAEGGFDAAFGGARRDEEKSRAKERIYSFRDSLGQWDPKNQRPELWNIFNSRLDKGESIRVFPLSNWTELDVWLYIHVEKIPIVPLYFAKERDVVLRNGSIVVIDHPSQLLPGEKTQRVKCRMRSLGCVPCTGAIRSDADTVPKIIEEMVSFRRSERENRAIDHDEEGSMELKKREGYF